MERFRLVLSYILGSGVKANEKARGIRSKLMESCILEVGKKTEKKVSDMLLTKELNIKDSSLMIYLMVEVS